MVLRCKLLYYPAGATGTLISNFLNSRAVWPCCSCIKFIWNGLIAIELTNIFDRWKVQVGIRMNSQHSFQWSKGEIFPKITTSLEKLPKKYYFYHQFNRGSLTSMQVNWFYLPCCFERVDIVDKLIRQWVEVFIWFQFLSLCCSQAQYNQKKNCLHDESFWNGCNRNELHNLHQTSLCNRKLTNNWIQTTTKVYQITRYKL